MWEAKTTVLIRTVRGMRHKHEKTGNDQRRAPAPLHCRWCVFGLFAALHSGAK
jgi:hypothetical protein